MTIFSAPALRWQPLAVVQGLLVRQSWRLTLPLMLLTLFALAALHTTALELRAGRERTVTAASARVAFEAVDAARHFADDLDADDAASLAETLAILATDRGFALGVLVDADGRVLLASDGRRAGSRFDAVGFPAVLRMPSRLRHEVIDDSLYTAVPVRLTTAAAGDVQATGAFYRRDDLTGALSAGARAALFESAWRMLGIAMLLLVVWWIHEHGLRQRLACIVAAAHAVGGGRLGVRAMLTGDDELARLAEAFNRMVEALEREQGALSAQAIALAASNADLAALRYALDAHAIVSITDDAGIITHVNDKFCEVSGYRRDELLGQNHRLLKSGAHAHDVYRQLWRTIRSGRAWHGVLHNRRKDGSDYWVQSSILPLSNADPARAGFISLRTDITARERLRIALDTLARIEPGSDSFGLQAAAVGEALDGAACGVLAFTDDGTSLRALGAWPATVSPPSGALPESVRSLRERATGLAVAGDLRAALGDDALLGAMREGWFCLEPLLDEGGTVCGLVYLRSARVPEDEASARALLATVAQRASADLARLTRAAERARDQIWLEFVVRGADAGVWDWDLATDTVHFNARWASMLGYNLEDLPSTVDAWAERIHPDDRTMAMQAVRAHLDGLTPIYSCEHRLLCRDGTWIWVLDRGMVTERAADGAPSRMSGMHIDITAQKQAQFALQQEQERLALVIENTPVGLWETDLTTDTITVTARWLERLGYSAEQVPRTSRDWVRLVHPDDRERVRADLRAFLDGRSANYVVDYRIASVTEGWRWVLSRCVISARDAAGRPTRLTGIHLDIHEQRDAAEILRINEQRLQTVIQAGDLGVWDWDLEGQVFTHNARMASMLGYAHDVLVTRADWNALLHPDDFDACAEAMRAHLDGRQHVFNAEMRLRTQAGNWRWILSRGQAVARADDGRVLRMMGIHLDISDRKAAEAALAESRARLDLVLEAAEIGVYEWDVNSGEHRFDERWAGMLGYRREEVGADIAAWRALLHPDEVADIEADVTSLLAGERDAYEHETRLRAKDGSWVWVLDRGLVTERDGQGRGLRAAGIHIDITRRKQTEAALLVSEARLRAVIDHSPIGIFSTDERGGVLFVNASLRRMFTLADGEGLGDSWVGLVHADDRERATREWREYAASNALGYETEYRYDLPGRGVFHVRLRAARVHAETLQLGHIGVLEDITGLREREREHEQMRLQVQQAQKMEAIGQLAGGIAHDFNNILTAVIGFSTLALARHVPDRSSKLAEYLSGVITAGERGRDLVGKMLAFSRGNPADAVQALAVAPLVQEVVLMLGTLIPSSMHFDVAVDEDIAPVYIDAVDLHQVLVNLVVNARDALDSHGRISLHAHAADAQSGHCSACQAPFSGNYVCISVRDDGCGMDEATVARIFDPFFTTKEVGKGSGMGLAVVHGIVHRAGGHIVVTSRPGRGTEFRLLLRAAPVAVDAPAPAHAMPRPGQPGLRVLIVEDEPAVRRLLSELLAGEGMQVTVAADGAEALRLFAAQAGGFDAILTDQTMPEMTGAELIRSLRAQGLQVPIVLCSGYSDAATREAMRQPGVTYVPKPADPEKIIGALQACVAERCVPA